MGTTRESLFRLLKDMESAITKAKTLLETFGRDGQKDEGKTAPPRSVEDIRAIADRPAPPGRSGPRKSPG